MILLPTGSSERSSEGLESRDVCQHSVSDRLGSGIGEEMELQKTIPAGLKCDLWGFPDKHDEGKMKQ